MALLAGCAASSPKPVPVDTNGGETATEQVSRCLAEKGWEIVDASNGEVRVTKEQVSVYNEDLEACTQEVLGNVDTSPLNDSELADLFEVENGVASCLEDLGYEVEVPSLQVFIDGYHSGNPFTAYTALFGVSQQEWSAANEACPQAADLYQR